MTEFSYESDLNGGSLMVRESRVVADLLLKNSSNDEWHKVIQLENRLQKRSPATAKRNAQAIRKRLDTMEPEFWRAIRDGDDELATQVAYASVLNRNLLLVEFIEQVLKDLFALHAEKLELYHWMDFIEDCASKEKYILDWKESTKKKMGQVVIRMLAEAGYLESTRSRKLQSVIVRPEVSSMLNNTFRKRLLHCMDLKL